MVKDAEANAEEDRKQVELVHARNQADNMIHSVKKALTEHGDKVGADEKGKIEAAIAAAEEALKGNDKSTIESTTQALAAASQKLGEKAYAQAGAGAESPTGKDTKTADADVVDAEFEEVKDKK
jgi:molecular chaperone DnaK